jgi:hypothetical protein
VKRHRVPVVEGDRPDREGPRRLEGAPVERSGEIVELRRADRGAAEVVQRQDHRPVDQIAQRDLAAGLVDELDVEGDLPVELLHEADVADLIEGTRRRGRGEHHHDGQAERRNREPRSA